MSFKFLFFTILILLSSCGVKGPPRPPQDTLLPAVESQYLETQESDENKDKKNKKEQSGD